MLRPFEKMYSSWCSELHIKKVVPRVLLEAMSMGTRIVHKILARCRGVSPHLLHPMKDSLSGKMAYLSRAKNTHLSLAMTLLPQTHSNAAPNTLTQIDEQMLGLLSKALSISRVIAHYTRAVTSILKSSLLREIQLY